MALIFRSSLRQRKYDALISAGFFPPEATEFSRTSRSGMRAPYFRRMVKSRRRTLDNSIRYEWTRAQYEAHIKKMYVENGFLKQDKLGRIRIDPWQLLRYHEEVAYRRGEEFESPWRVRIRRKGVKKREVKRTTRKDALLSWIKQLDANIERTENERRKQKLIEQRKNLQAELDKMGG